MAEQSFNFQELVRQLGLKNVDELPVIRALTPVINVGDAADITSAMLPRAAFAGGQVGAVAAERASLQIRSLGSGGIVVLEWRIGAATQVDFRIDRDGTDPLAVDPIVGGLEENNNFGFGDAQATVNIGTSTVAVPNGAVLRPVGGDALRLGTADLRQEMFIPPGGLLTIQNSTVNVTGYFYIAWRELVAPALTPAG